LQVLRALRWLLLSFLMLLATALFDGTGASASVHSAPVVLQGHRIKLATHYPVQMYRLFKTDEKGAAVSIPFQIDEINEWGDYVLPSGGTITANTGNGIFDLQDEIAFMGDDVGPIQTPKSFPEGKTPSLLFEIKASYPGKNVGGDDNGAVYLGIYFQNPPALSERSYVFFKTDTAEVITSRYRYGFDQKNWLVSRRVEMLKKGTEKTPDFVPLLESTTFFMKADLKYFLTVEASHRSIESALEAYKIGPVRSIVRISFHYTFLKLNFELGMYTEVSFFSNAVYLPAILYNPLNGKKSLNSGSGFYYGMAMRENPGDFRIETNMPPYKKSGLLSFLGSAPKVEDLYWIMATGKDRMLYMEISPSKEMRAEGAIPMLYREDKPGPEIKDRNKDAPKELGESNVNMALYFDMTKFSDGEHSMAFRLFFENVNDTNRLETFKNLANWQFDVKRIRD
jgi:hypothetical protein